MIRVVIESPYAGEVDSNIWYAKKCMLDSLYRGEAPLASHLLYTQEGMLKDSKLEDRTLGIAAGHAWIEKADAVVVYWDRGVSHGMLQGIRIAIDLGIPLIFRTLGDTK
jgi:hypothetical protein